MALKAKKGGAGLDFGTAFSYVFNRPKGMLNILWVLLPIFGWFALIGYNIRILREFSVGKFKQLPIMKFGDDMKLGFVMVLKALPFVLTAILFFMILYRINFVLVVIAEVFFCAFLMPMLFMNFVNKASVASFFEFGKVAPVFENFGEYLLVLVKSILLALVFFVMIIVLVGIPASVFTKNMFLADFYRRRVK